LFYVFIKSLQKIFEINRNLKQIRSITKDTEITSSVKDINTVRDILQHALKRIEFVISEVGQHRGHTLSYVETSRLRDGLKDLREINCCVKEMFISLKLLLHEFKPSSVK
jgi:sensor histidine kinase regulating citrate/malate metabolism